MALSGLVGTSGDAFAQTPSSTSVIASPNPGVIGQQVTLTATVTTGPFLAQGQVQFFDGATSLGTGFVGGGFALFTTSSLALALQLFFLRQSESMGNHDSEVEDADAHSVD